MNDATNSRDLFSNRILSSIPKSDYETLFPHLEYVELPLGRNLYQPDEPISYIYFPLNGTISLTAIMESGAEVEVGVVGREGMLGLPVVLGTDSAPLKAMVQLPGGALRMSGDAFKEKVDDCGEFYRMLLRYAQAFFVQTAITAACNRLHHLEGRLARWLLMCHDRAQSEAMPLTQEFMAIMLGVRRSGVTEAASKLQEEKVIEYNRGKLRIIDEQRLKAISCECYEVVKKEFDRLVRG